MSRKLSAIIYRPTRPFTGSREADRGGKPPGKSRWGVSRHGNLMVFRGKDWQEEGGGASATSEETDEGILRRCYALILRAWTRMLPALLMSFCRTFPG